MVTAAAGEGQLGRLSIPVTGMTCAACASRIQRKLERSAGVREASVNFGTERASVVYDPAAVGAVELVSAVRSAGYDARTDVVVLDVAGLEWAATGEPVERELSKVPGVLTAAANLGTSQARVEAACVAPEALKLAVEAAATVWPGGSGPAERSAGGAGPQRVWWRRWWEWCRWCCRCR
jgi:Cu+-exporting ATPase